MRRSAPDWIEQVAGTAPLLLVAPHGGRRPERDASELQAPRKSNDLYTAELTLELARRTGATALVNRVRDRNDLDLNRVTHVRRGAPEFFARLLDAARVQIEARGEARFFFVHGWNAIQASCDVGVGARLRNGRLEPVREGHLTIPERFVPRLRELGGRCRRAGIDLLIGDRYPAAAKENVLQAFTARYADDGDPGIRELAALGAAGRICAVQLELAIPLRWPGPLRERFLEELVAWLNGETGGPDDVLADGFPPSVGTPEHVSLEFHDGALGLGGFAAIERAATGRRFGRFLLCLGAARLGLFTGEAPPGRSLSCGPLAWMADGDGYRLEYDGPFLVFPTTDPFLDLEAGLAGATLGHLRASLDWRPFGKDVAPAARPGIVRGEGALDGAAFRIETPAILGRGSSASPEAWRERRILHVPLGEDLDVSIGSLVSPASDREVISGGAFREGRTEPLLSARVHVRRLGGAPAGFRVELVTRSGPLRAFGQVTTAVPVVRTIDHQRTLTWLGLARFTAGKRVGYGTFEVSNRLGETNGADAGSEEAET